ncbi:MAG: serine hydroxymethyltransferase [Minisyncoccia bacterium]|jgi:glycine hydroxymethyltransferase
MRDKIVENLINKETRRQANTLDLIASENYVSSDVLRALGSVFTNKYAEGYAHARYYAGNDVVDELEDLTKIRALKLFKLSPKEWSVNIQPYSGSPANLAVYLALVPIGEKIMGLRLDMGGHLTHGHKVSATGKLWKIIPYAVNKGSGQLDYGEVSGLAKKERPKLIIAGYSAYSRSIDFKKFQRIAKSSGAIFMVDMSHFAGLVAAGAYPSPFDSADVVTTTMHKTLRGPRAALIFSRKKYSEAIDKSVFPGLQGGPHANQIAATAVALKEASEGAFRKYARQVVKNAKALAETLKKNHWKVISGGTDSHLFLVDTWARGLSGQEACELLEEVGIVANKNTIPFDTRTPMSPSGIRLGTPAITTRGLKERDVKTLGRLISEVLMKEGKTDVIKKEVARICKKFPIH